MNYYDYQRKMTISSPILLSAPVEISPTTLLYQETIYPLTRLVMNQREGHDAQLWKSSFLAWPSFVDAFALWEVWQDGGPLGEGHENIVRWLYQNSQERLPYHLLPDGHDRLCRTYRIWHFSPSALMIPLTCTDEDKVTGEHRNASLKSLVPLKMLHLITHPNDAESAEKPFDMAITGESVIEYIVATYGRDKLPSLVDGLGRYVTLDALIPALFGLSLSDFETGWQTYLAQHYGLGR
jgi:hypothetical protein